MFYGHFCAFGRLNGPPTAKEILLSMTFSELPFSRRKLIQDSKVINQDTCLFNVYFYGIASSSQAILKIQGHFQDLETEFVIFQVFQDAWNLA